MPRVPASVTAPVVAVLGVRPVLPAEKLATVFAVVANVPLVGKVTFVVPVVVSVVANAPEVVRLPPSVIVLVPLLTPVPPCVPVRGSERDVPQLIPVETAIPAAG